jgi:hypothetical protein
MQPKIDSENVVKDPLALQGPWSGGKKALAKGLENACSPNGTYDFHLLIFFSFRFIENMLANHTHT